MMQKKIYYIGIFVPYLHVSFMKEKKSQNMGIAKPKSGYMQGQLVVLVVETQSKWKIDRNVHMQCYHYHQEDEVAKIQSTALLDMLQFTGFKGYSLVDILVTDLVTSI